ncbi:MAG: M64 family metallopeptidase [Bacteroidota bacterium]
MRALLLLILLVIPLMSRTHGAPVFNDFFIDATMRVDYYHTGNSADEIITVDRIYRQGIWAGSTKNLVDEFNNGRYYAKIYDAKTGTLIYSRGFDSYFGEYKLSDEALKGIKRTYHESVLIPWPKAPVLFTLEVRDRQNRLQRFFETQIDPEDISIIKDRVSDAAVKVIESYRSGDPHTKADIVILGEGYTAKETAKFESDLKKFTGVFFSQEPYRSYRNSFNIYGVLKPSEESGCDEPDRGTFRNTALNTTFNSLGSERYLLTEDNRTMRDLAAHVPYDAIYIMVNHNRYGGGGIYNLFCTFTTDNQWYEYLFLHEFGHSFAGLADEYYTSDVAYNEFYPKGIEPVEPNITALAGGAELKWKDKISKGIDIPTPWEKANYDSSDYAYQKIRRELNSQIADAKRSGAPKRETDILETEAERLSREHADRADEYLHKSRYWGKVGAYEGAGYAAQGLYRPMLDCIMFSKGKKPFCRVCEDAIVRVIKHYE